LVCECSRKVYKRRGGWARAAAALAAVTAVITALVPDWIEVVFGTHDHNDGSLEWVGHLVGLHRDGDGAGSSCSAVADDGAARDLAIPHTRSRFLPIMAVTVVMSLLLAWIGCFSPGVSIQEQAPDWLIDVEVISFITSNMIILGFRPS